jgi:hypothetical protein
MANDKQERFMTNFYKGSNPHKRIAETIWQRFKTWQCDVSQKLQQEKMS